MCHCIKTDAVAAAIQSPAVESNTETLDQQLEQVEVKLKVLQLRKIQATCQQLEIIETASPIDCSCD